MKKICSILLVVILCLTFVGCENAKKEKLYQETVVKEAVKQSLFSQVGNTLYSDSITFDSIEKISDGKYKVTGTYDYLDENIQKRNADYDMTLTLGE